MNLDLAGRAALVTGGGTGIGRAIVVALVELGMSVHICGRTESSLSETASAIPGDVSYSVCDLAMPDQVDDLYAKVKGRFDSLFLLVNNAAIGIYAPFDEVDPADWRKMTDVNLHGAFQCSQQAFRWMKATGGGRIVNISSVCGHKGYVNQSGYTASKHALMGMTKVIAREGQEFGIRCSAICPGGVATEMVKRARPDLDPAGLIQPQDVARATVYLAAEPESCCTDVLYLRRAGSTPFA